MFTLIWEDLKGRKHTIKTNMCLWDAIDYYKLCPDNIISFK